MTSTGIEQTVFPNDSKIRKDTVSEAGLEVDDSNQLKEDESICCQGGQEASDCHRCFCSRLQLDLVKTNETNPQKVRFHS